METILDLNERRRRYIDVFEQRGDPALSYLRDHALRFLRTHDLVFAGANGAPPLALLDVASHWLHGAFLFAESGVAVTALDVEGGEISHPSVLRFAQEQGIALLPCRALSDPVELESIPDDSFDLVLFTETIEHLTFNPIRLWSRIYRKMKVGGRIIVTTPNYFYLKGAIWHDIRKILRGYSAGIAIDDVLREPDYAPHWKELSRKDLQRYFACLSPDFTLATIEYVSMYSNESGGSMIGRLARKCLPAALTRDSLYAEVVLTGKHAGIAAPMGR